MKEHYNSVSHLGNCGGKLASLNLQSSFYSVSTINGDRVLNFILHFPLTLEKNNKGCQADMQHKIVPSTDMPNFIPISQC